MPPFTDISGRSSFRSSLAGLVFLLLIPLGLTGQETFRDEFNAVSYSNSDGTVGWDSDWIESGDTDNGPTAQYVYITGNQLRMEFLFTEDIRRTANLTGATFATLSFDYTTNSLSGQRTLGIYVSNNGGASFTQIANISGSGSFSQSITAYISANTVIRFAKSNQDWQSDDWAQLDNIQITADVSSRLNVPDITVSENDGTATITVTHAGPSVSGPFTVNYATSDISATAGADYTAVSGTLSFTGVQGDTETIIVPLLDDGLYENDETFLISLSGISDPAVGSSDTGTTTIQDDEIILDDVPLSLYRNINGNYDYTTAGGTFRTADNATDPCAITTTSSATVTSTIPAGAEITEAYLFWSHSAFTPDAEVTFEGQTVLANVAYSAGFTGRNFYGYLADVTGIIQGISSPGTNTYDLTDLDIDTSTDYCSTATVLGAWSLMIFYEEPSLAASTINLYYGFDITQNAGTSFTLDSFYAISASGSKATFLSFEGDANLDGSSSGSTNPEELSITNQSGTNFVLSGDGGQTGNNVYNSTVYDEPAGLNTSGIYGLDLDTYDISPYVSASDTQVTANVDVGQDLVISAAVVIRVPSNLISGMVFEDVNYPGGSGRNEATANGPGIPNATVELYDSSNVLHSTTLTEADGGYAFGGMADGNYKVRVVNQSVLSTRGGGSGCASCYAVQTFRSSFDGTNILEVTDEVGGANPAATADAIAGTLTGAQTISDASIFGGGTGGVDFGFNFNTIVNTNETGQGSFDQFVINANNLDESTLDIEANSLFDPGAGEDVSIFVIPTSSDPMGRTADLRYTSGYFDIYFSNTINPEDLTSDNLIIDGRTQTAYSGDTNSGNVGAGGTSVGTTSVTLPSYDLPEIQIHRDGGDVIVNTGNNNAVRYVSIFANNNSGIRVSTGSVSIESNLIGVNALGNNAGNINVGIENQGGNISAIGNYIATNTDNGIILNGGTSSLVQLNHINANGDSSCDDNIRISGGDGIVIQQNLIENAASLGIDAASHFNGILLTENTITTSGQVAGDCGGGPENMGVELNGSNSTISFNIFFDNGGAGLATTGNGTGNLISQNSFFNNGTVNPALGIDLNGDGVTLNDSADIDSGSNNLLNFPIIISAYIQGTDLIVKGWSGAGATIEFYFSDINEGTAVSGDNQLGLSQDYGEGQVYIATLVEGSGSDLSAGVSAYADTDGNADNTNEYQFQIPLPAGTELGELLTATATISNSTSEFSPMSEIVVRTVITNRRITYRVNPQ